MLSTRDRDLHIFILRVGRRKLTFCRLVHYNINFKIKSHEPYKNNISKRFVGVYSTLRNIM